MSVLTWIVANKEALGAALIAAYGFTRIVVNLTPTPRDNAAFDKVSAWLTVPAKLFGLDLSEGRNISPAEEAKLVGLDPPVDLPTRPDVHRTDGEWGGRNPRDLVK